MSIADLTENEQFAAIYHALEHDQAQLYDLIKPLHPADIAFLIESLPYNNQRLAVWKNCSLAIRGDILFEINESIRPTFVEQMSTSELVYVTSSMDYDELADILKDMPSVVSQVLLESMETQHRKRLEAVLSYPDDSAGSIMNTDIISIRADITLETVFRYLRAIKKLPDTTDKLFVVDHFGIFQGILYLSDLLTHPPGMTVRSVMHENHHAIDALLPLKDVMSLFERRDLISAAVIDKEKKLLGRITIDDVVDLIRDEGEHNMMGQVGLSEEDDMFAPIMISARRRAVWLGINLVTALMASFVIGMFQGTIEKIVALAVLMPIVASMGGITGSQTLTLVIRGLAVGQLTQKNFKKLFFNELMVSAINGVLWATVLAIITGLWFDDYRLSVVIALAILINLVIAAFSGVLLPKAIEHFGADPALGGGVILTTITDIFGFLAFLGLATIFLI